MEHQIGRQGDRSEPPPANAYEHMAESAAKACQPTGRTQQDPDDSDDLERSQVEDGDRSRGTSDRCGTDNKVAQVSRQVDPRPPAPSSAGITRHPDAVRPEPRTDQGVSLGINAPVRTVEPAAITIQEPGEGRHGTRVEADRATGTQQAKTSADTMPFSGLDIRPDMPEDERVQLREYLVPRRKADRGVPLIERWYDLIHDLVTHKAPYAKVLGAMCAGRDKEEFVDEFGSDHRKFAKVYRLVRAGKAQG